MAARFASSQSASKGMRKTRSVESAQLSLFDAPLVESTLLRPAAPATDEPPPLPVRGVAPRSTGAVRLDALRVITIDDMPDYPSELCAAVDRTLEELREERVLLMTYRAIKACFGISRATVARRVKEGLVPGVRMAHGRVLDDGPVRRFDRTQLRWLLLAVRYGSHRLSK